MIINLACQSCPWRDTSLVTWGSPSLLFGHLKTFAGPVSVSLETVPNKEAP